jgi:hypothetical protein
MLGRRHAGIGLEARFLLDDGEGGAIGLRRVRNFKCFEGRVQVVGPALTVFRVSGNQADDALFDVAFGQRSRPGGGRFAIGAACHVGRQRPALLLAFLEQ